MRAIFDENEICIEKMSNERFEEIKRDAAANNSTFEDQYFPEKITIYVCTEAQEVGSKILR